MADWNEIQQLAADLQRAQLGGTVQRLSERNCIEIVNYLINNGMLKVIYTADGKEYLTHKQLERELDDELFVCRGRVTLSELAVNLNVDYSHVEHQAQQLSKHDPNVHLVLGQLINSSYLDDMAEQLNEKLQIAGTLTVSTLAKEFNLPADFLFEQVINRLGKIIQGFQDEHDPKVILTPAFMARNKAKIRGALTALTAPMSVSAIVKEIKVDAKMFFNLAEEMIRDNTIKGSITGGRQKATFVPSNYAKAQNEWVDNFFKQNGYLEYDALSRLGISDPKATIKRKFSDEPLTFLRSCCIGKSIIDMLEVQIEEALATQGFVDVLPHLPSVLSPDDVTLVLADVLKSDKAVIFCETLVVSKACLSSIEELFAPEVELKAVQMINSGKYAQFVKSQQVTEKMDLTDIMEGKMDKKDERRKKAAEGKAGGGAMGRETKTKAAKKKTFRGKEDSSGSSVQSKGLEFMGMSELADKLSSVTILKDAPEDLCDELARHFYPHLEKQFESKLASLYQTSMTASMQSKKRNFHDFQDKINSLVENVRLFEKGLACLDQREPLEKYLLKTLCTEVVNEALLYVAQEHQILQEDCKDVTADLRNKWITQLPKDVGKPMSAMVKSLDSIDDFLSCLDENLASACDVMIKKSDRKKDRQIVFNHRQNLMSQVESCQDPALTLHLAALVLFQCQTGCMLHASGKFVPTIIAKVSEQLDEDSVKLLNDYQNWVVSQLSTKDPEAKAAFQKQLEEHLKAVKDVALSAKKQNQ